MTGPRGITLIELVVAMAVFALVSVLGLQALSGSLRSREILSERAESSATLARLLALLRHDLNAAIPMAFYPPGAERAASAITEDRNSFALSRGGVPQQAGSPRIGRVDWTLRDGALMRQSWPTLTPLSPGQQSPALLVMNGITALSWRSYWPPDGWVTGLLPPRTPPTGGPQSTQDDAEARLSGRYSSELPEAVELTLTTRDFGSLVLVERLR